MDHVQGIWTVPVRKLSLLHKHCFSNFMYIVHSYNRKSKASFLKFGWLWYSWLNRPGKSQANYSQTPDRSTLPASRTPVYLMVCSNADLRSKIQPFHALSNMIPNQDVSRAGLHCPLITELSRIIEGHNLYERSQILSQRDTVLEALWVGSLAIHPDLGFLTSLIVGRYPNENFSFFLFCGYAQKQSRMIFKTWCN